MEKNVGGLDEGIRITLGPLLVVVSLASLGGTIRLRRSVALAAFAVGAILTVTGVTQTCPANSLLGRNTYRSDGTADEPSEEVRQIRDRALH